MPLAKLLTADAADKAGAAALAGLLVLATGATALALNGGTDDVPETAAEAPPDMIVPAPAVEPTEVDHAGVDVVEVPAQADEAPTAGESSATEPTDAPAATDGAAPPAAPTDEAVATVDGVARLVLEVSGDVLRTVVTVHNRGDGVSGPVLLAYEGLADAGGVVRVLDTEGPVAACQQWFCAFDDIPPGEAVAAVVFTVDAARCLDVQWVGRVTLEHGHDDVQHVDVPWCDPQGIGATAGEVLDTVEAVTTLP